MRHLELLEHTDTVNELLARYGVKFGIYKNNVFESSCFHLILFRESLRKRNLHIWSGD